MKVETGGPVKVLQVLPILQAAGVENYTMSLYRNISRDKVQFDFLVHSKKKSAYDNEVEKLGGRIYRLTYKDDNNFFKYKHDLNSFFKNHPEYKIVHGEMQSMMPVYLGVAKKYKVPVRIAHAHNSDYEKTVKGFLLHLLSRLTPYVSSVNLACSGLAGRYLFGKKKYIFAPNAIDTERFKFSEKARKQIRDKYDISDSDFVIGSVARFDLQKNHMFMLDVFANLRTKQKAKLMLVGGGRLEQEIRKYAEDLKITNDVIFVGIQNDTSKFLSAMDVLFMPSLYEGLPVSVIEAQCSGLRCVVSDTITREVNILKMVDFVSLDSTKEIWARALLGKKAIKSDRINTYRKIQATDFDIKKNAKDFEKMYLNMYRREA